MYIRVFINRITLKILARFYKSEDGLEIFNNFEELWLVWSFLKTHAIFSAGLPHTQDTQGNLGCFRVLKILGQLGLLKVFWFF